MSDVRIVEIVPVGPPEKDPRPWNSDNKYRVPVVYVLEDGQRLEVRMWFGLLRDAKAFVAAGVQHPTNKAAWFSDGVFGGTVEYVRIGGGAR